MGTDTFMVCAASCLSLPNRYGDEAGQLATESMPAAQDMMQACLNCTRLGARAAISKTAKKTASVYLKSTLAGVTPEEQAKGVRAPGAAAP
jgi:hypothetical protein